MKIISDDFDRGEYGGLAPTITTPYIYKCKDFTSVSMRYVYARKNLKENDSYLFYLGREANIVVIMYNEFVEFDTMYEVNRDELKALLDMVGEGLSALHNNDLIAGRYKEMFECIIGGETSMEKENNVFTNEPIRYYDKASYVLRSEYEDYFHPYLSFSNELLFGIEENWIEGSVEQIYFCNNMKNPEINRCGFAVFSYDDEYDDGFIEGFERVGINKVLGIDEFELDTLYHVDYHDLIKLMKLTKDLLQQYYPAKNSKAYQDSMNRMIKLFDLTAEWTNL